MQVLLIVAAIIRLDLGILVKRLPGRRVLGSHDDLCTITAGLHPFTDDAFRLALLVVTSTGVKDSKSRSYPHTGTIGLDLRIEEIPTLTVEIIQQFKGCRLVARSHDGFPCRAKPHRPQADGAYFNGGRGRKLTVIAQKALGPGGRARQVC
jgi:hypothetical protein